MTHAEAYQELARDRENLARWWDRQAAKYRRLALKTQRFPVTWAADYTSPRKVQYMLIVTCLKRRFDDNYGVTTLALRRESKGYTAYLVSMFDTDHTTLKKMVFIPHVFDRYADPERGNVQKKGLDLIRHMFVHTNGGSPLKNQRLASRSVRYKGRDNLCFATSEGVLLGDMEGDIFIARTFITYEMAGGLQRKEFCAARDTLPDKEGEVRYAIHLSKTGNDGRPIQTFNNLRL